MNWIMTWSLSRQMDQKPRWENIIFDIVEYQNADQELYEMPNRGIILEPKSLQIEEWFAGHDQMFLVGMGVRWKVCTKGPQKHFGYRRQFPMRGINSEVYPKKRSIHDFQVPLIVQKHGDDKNPSNELLLTEIRNSSSPKYVHSW